jgi:hypothetical protein
MIPVIIAGVSSLLVIIGLIIGLVVYMNSVNASSTSTSTNEVEIIPANQPPQRKYAFFQGVDSDGGDIKHESGLTDNISGLENSCNNTEGCVAFNTNGWIKHSVLPRDQWSNWTDDPNKGFYLLQSE